MATDRFTLEYSDKLAIITLNNHSKLNALTADLYYHLATLLNEVAARPDIYVTLLTGSGRFFSADPLSGADVKAGLTATDPTPKNPVHRQYLTSFLPNNLHLTRTFSRHPKILITALNGPVIGLSAALISHSDFIYCTPSTYLLTPFTSLGLVAEGGASVSFVQRMGIAKANEALIMSKKMTSEELKACGFVNEVFDETTQSAFQSRVRREIHERLLGGHLNLESLVKIKELVRRPGREEMELAGVEEVFGGVDRFVGGAPQEEFRRIAHREKRHKL